MLVWKVRKKARNVLPPSFIPRTEAERLFAGKTGLEIGGASPSFRRRLPLYRLAARVDNCNYAEDEVRFTEIEGDRFAPGNGRQFIAEATDLHFAAANSYDFIASSHCLEHVANPIKALREWRRVLKPGGPLALILPDGAQTFDNRRPMTLPGHMVEDYENDIGEDDLSHLEEILRLHDLRLDRPARECPEGFEERSRNNARNRYLHHHVFDADNATAVVSHAGFDVLQAGRFRPHDIFVLAQKPEG